MALVDLTEHGGRIFDGTWRPAEGGTVEVLEKATGTPLATVGLADATDVRAAATVAAHAQPGWAATAPVRRAQILRTAARLLEDVRDEVAAWLVREGGGVRDKAQFEVGAAVDELWAAADLPTRPHGSLLASVPGRDSVGRRLPLGVVGVISPWNMPLLLGLRSVAPALALGNAVVLKPDVQTPVSGGLVAARLFQQAGLPAGVLHVLPGDAEPGAALTADPDVDMISFTGSTAVGRLVGETAGRLLKRVALELGGNNAFLVLDDADLDAASSAGAWASFFHAGQVCMAAGRHIVLAAVAEEYLALLTKRAAALRVGDPSTEDVELGPMINATQLARAHRIVTDTVAAGAELLTGGTFDGPFYRPTVLAGVTPDMPAFTEEIFGPVAPVIIVADEDEAVEIANRTEYGLSAAVQTGDVRRGARIAGRLRTGLVHVNDQTINDDAYSPFGGRGASGNGARYGAEQSWELFTSWQWLTLRDTPTRYPF